MLSVNVSGVQFKGASELEREIEASLTRWNIDPTHLELELTESVLMEATHRHSNTLEKLRQLGIKISIDDFGTGYSSLKYLTQYRVNRLKLAQEFVFRVTVDYRNAAVVRAAIRLANELGLEVIAEGVETEAQARFLMGAGCEQAQGYYFSRPVPAAQGRGIAAGRAHRAASGTVAAAHLGGVSAALQPITPNSEVAAAQGVEAAAVALGRPRTLRRPQARAPALADWRGQILIQSARQACRSAPLGRPQHPDHGQPAEPAGGHHVAGLNEAARFQRAGAIDADLAGFDQPRRARPRLGEPRAPQPLVEALRIAWPWAQLPSGWRAASRPLSASSAAKGECSTFFRSGRRVMGLRLLPLAPRRGFARFSRRGLWLARLSWRASLRLPGRQISSNSSACAAGASGACGCALGREAPASAAPA